MVNRGAILLRYKEPFVRWINETDPGSDDPGITLKIANEERTVYLISDEDAEFYEQWIEDNYQALFENELGSWYTDESLWPKERSKAFFDEWFEVECHTVIVDTVGGELVDDEV